MDLATRACLQLNRLTSTGGTGDVLKLDFSQKNFAFMQADDVHVCYAPQGQVCVDGVCTVVNQYSDQGAPIAFHVTIKVLGAHHTCNYEGCFAEQNYHACFGALNLPCSKLDVSTENPSLSIVGDGGAPLSSRSKLSALYSNF